jgi:indolepyruvate decarboxylase
LPSPVPRPAPAAPAPTAAITFTKFFELIESFVDDTMVVLADESDSMYVSSAMRIPRPGGYAAQAAWGSIGYTVAGAVGVGLGSGRRPVVFVGDGGFQMTCPALSTLQRERLGAIVFVMNNDVYGIEQALVDLGPFHDPNVPFRPYNVLPTWDYVKLAEAFGGLGIKVASFSQLTAALKVAIARTEDLTVIQVVIPSRDLPPPIERLASDTGYPRFPNPAQSAAIRLSSFRARASPASRQEREELSESVPVESRDAASDPKDRSASKRPKRR